MVIYFVLLGIAAYLLGSVPAAYLVVKWSRGIDIRQYGTGNVGASNVLSITSKWLAIPVTIFDIGKGALVISLAQLLGLDTTQQITVGAITVIGHNWPVFLRFQGGRGIFTTLGVTTILSPWLGLIILTIAYSMAPFRQLALGVLLALASMPIFSWFLPQLFDIEEKLPITLGFVVLLLIALVKRLATPRIPLSKSVPRGRLFINRLLFDRDIKDRKAWLEGKKPQETEEPRKGCP